VTKIVEEALEISSSISDQVKSISVFTR